MDAASQNSSFLLASLISGQGAGTSVIGASQVIDNSEKSSSPSFLSTFNLTTQKLQPEELGSVTPLDMDGLLIAVEKLLAGHAATTGSSLPLSEGQGFAANMSNEDVLSVISQLQGEGAEALVGQLANLLHGLTSSTGNAGSLPGLQGLTGMASNESIQKVVSQLQGTTELELTTQQHRQQVDALFSKIRQLFENATASDSWSRHSQTTMVNIELADQLALQSQPGDKGLLERLNAAVLPQQSLASDASKAGVNLRQVSAEPGLTLAGDNSDSFSTPDIARDLFGKAVVTPVPVLLERMAAVSNERQLNSGILESIETPASIVQLGKAEGLLANSASRPMSSIIHSPLTAPQWQSEFSDKIMMMSRVAGQGQNQVAEIRLNPAHLGPIEVRVAMKDDQASIIFSAQHGVVRDAIEASLPRLREMFSNSGLMLADADVSEHSLQHHHRQGRQPESGEQYANTDPALSMNEQTELISQIDLSMISSSAALDLYA